MQKIRRLAKNMAATVERGLKFFYHLVVAAFLHWLLFYQPHELLPFEGYSQHFTIGHVLGGKFKLPLCRRLFLLNDSSSNHLRELPCEP